MSLASLPAERLLVLLSLGALALVLGALGFQYAGYAPCEMCHWQRWPHLAAAATGLVVAPLLKMNRRLTISVVGLTVLIALMAAYRWDMLNVWQAQVLALVVGGLFAATLGGGARRLTWIVIALIAVSGLIALYQTGMQIGWLPGPQACTAKRFIMGSDMIPEIQCDLVTWSLFGLSLAAYNAIFSLLMAAAGAVLLTGKRA